MVIQDRSTFSGGKLDYIYDRIARNPVSPKVDVVQTKYYNYPSTELWKPIKTTGQKRAKDMWSFQEGELVEEKQFHACMKKIKAGDKSALREIYEEYIGYIYSVVFQVVLNKEDAEDVTSEFFIKLWKLADTYQSRNGHKAWLSTIARNMAIDLLRKNKREVLVEDFTDSAPENASPDNVEGDVISDMSLKAALDTLKPAEREIVNMKILGELTFQEIADVLKQPLGTVTWRYQNAIKKLRRCGYE